MAWPVVSSMVKPSWEVKRAARSIRSGSSPNETSGGPGVRSSCATQVLDAAGRVDEHPFRQPQGHGVDREVAPDQVALEGAAERRPGLARRHRRRVAAVGRDLDRVPVDPSPDRAEGAADVPVRFGDRPTTARVSSGVRVGGEVEVVHRAAEEGVADRSRRRERVRARHPRRPWRGGRRALTSPRPPVAGWPKRRSA